MTEAEFAAGRLDFETVGAAVGAEAFLGSLWLMRILEASDLESSTFLFRGGGMMGGGGGLSSTKQRPKVPGTKKNRAIRS